MKISSFPNIVPLTSSLRPKRSDGEGGGARQQYDPNQTSDQDAQRDSQRKKKESEEGADPLQLQKAVESFQADQAAQEQGLSAVTEGTGSGLMVHVKDCNGTTLRLFSGHEFIRLREASTQPGLRTRGKILDQKF